jgi:topoisomerase-4 subunit A
VAYNYNNVVIIDKQPKQVGLLPILKAYLEHSRDVYTRKAKFELNEAQHRLEIIEGLVKAMSALDKVIAIIRKSQNRKDAMENLRDKFDFTKLQAEAIVDMRLYRLTSTDVEALHKEADELRTTIARLQKILRQPKALDAEMIATLEKVKVDFAIPRRSEISLVDESFEVDLKDTIVEKKYTLFVSRDGYLKALDASTMAKNE